MADTKISALPSATPTSGDQIPIVVSGATSRAALFTTGTFTPVLEFGGGTTGITYSTQAGRYLKIGDLVYFNINITLSNKGSSSGNAIITGLPFTIANLSNYNSTAYLFVSNLTYSGNPQTVLALNTAQVGLRNQASGGADAALDDGDFANDTTIRVSGMYIAD